MHIEIELQSLFCVIMPLILCFNIGTMWIQKFKFSGKGDPNTFRVVHGLADCEIFMETLGCRKLKLNQPFKKMLMTYLPPPPSPPLSWIFKGKFLHAHLKANVSTCYDIKVIFLTPWNINIVHTWHWYMHFHTILAKDDIQLRTMHSFNKCW